MKKSFFLITILLSLLITIKAKALSSIAIKDGGFHLFIYKVIKFC